MPTRALIWLKRDLRMSDHAPLSQAAACDEALAVFVIEPQWLRSPEFDPRHLAYALQCLRPLRDALAARGLPLLIRSGELPEVFAELRRDYQFTHLFSHEETGPGWSYARDRAVARWCRAAGVDWRQWPQTGVVRGLRRRDGWARQWQRRMDAPTLDAPARWRAPSGWSPDALADLGDFGLASPPGLPPAGEAAAWNDLDSFLLRRGRHYRRNISSPLLARDGGSRLSQHLSFGTLSLRQVHQATEARIADLLGAGDTEARAFAWQLRGFAARLRWHCHFMQKLEDEPEIESRNFVRGFDGMREQEFSPRLFEAWRHGMTGYPMVDACMRCLNATGWINFRMRAMLVSFAAYHLWLHWREPGLHLARQFIDFEPGIHWSQMQMQSGTTGINALRMYSPAKQAADHDPRGEFVRQWVPEWGSAAYPSPVVDASGALRRARQRLAAWRNSPQARAEAREVLERHGSRKSGLPPTRRRASAAVASPQLGLFE